MLQPNDESLLGIDGIITDIRMINLHLYNYITKLSNEIKPDFDLEKYNQSHIKEYLKRVNDYFRKCFKNALRIKVILTPLTFRFFKPKYKQENFLRFQNTNYGLKFVFTDFEREALLNIELYRRLRGGRISSLALRKLELCFMFELSQTISEGVTSIQQLQYYGKTILLEVTELMSGLTCVICSRHLSFNSEYKCYLPPTVREVSESRELKQVKKIKVYYHQGCLCD